jgi:Holliday junction resolvase RusA-like endonuclease
MGSGRLYDSQKDIKSVYQYSLAQAKNRSPLLRGPLSIEVDFYFDPPKRFKGDISRDHVSKPDLSNLIKFIEDVCNGIVFGDDSQICDIKARKLYGIQPRTELTVTELS